MRLEISSLAITDCNGVVTRAETRDGEGIVGGIGGRTEVCGGFIGGGVASGIFAPQYMQYFIAGANLLQLGQRIRGTLTSDK